MIFTLIELLVVIAIIARPDRPAAARRAGGPRGRPPGAVRQQPQADRPGRPILASAIGCFPGGSNVSAYEVKPGDPGENWDKQAMMLPYMEQSSVYNPINFSLVSLGGGGYDGYQSNTTGVTTMISTFQCPS